MFNFKIHAKKRAKMHFQFRNSYKKKAKIKKNGDLFVFFSVLYSMWIFFCIFKHQNSCKKDENAKKFFKLQKFICKQKSKILFGKDAKKACILLALLLSFPYHRSN